MNVLICDRMFLLIVKKSQIKNEIVPADLHIYVQNTRNICICVGDKSMPLEACRG